MTFREKECLRPVLWLQRGNISDVVLVVWAELLVRPS